MDNNRNSKNNSTRQAKINNNSQNNTNENQKTNEPSKPQTDTTTKTNTTTNTKTTNSVNTKTISTSESQNKNQTQLTKKENKNQNKSRNAIAAAIIIGVTILVAILATILGGKMRDGLINPPAYPPEWLFPLMWSIFYILIGIATFLAYKVTDGKTSQKNNLIWYGVHLFLNLLWPLFYFRLNLLIFSAIWLLAMVITSIVITYRYYRSKLSAGIIFTFYTLWLIYALYLNIGLAMLNAI